MKFILLILACALAFSASAQKSLVRKGNEFYKSGQFEYAERAFRQALEADPNDTAALYNLSVTLHMMGKYEDAARVAGSVAKMVKSKEMRSVAYYNQGVAYSRMNKLEASIESYKNALRLNPKEQIARENLQKALLQLKKQQQQNQQKKPSSNMNEKQADQKLKQLQQKEMMLQRRMNQKNTGGGQSQDW